MTNDDIQIVQGDCVALMKKLPDGFADSAVTDPPYNLGFKYATYNDARPAAEYEAWCGEWFAEMRRVVKGPIVMSPGHKNVAMWCRIAEPSWIPFWHKPAAMGYSPFSVCNSEPLLLWGKPAGKKCTDVFTFPTIYAPIVPQHDAAFHSCPKPLAWAVQLIEALTTKGQLVLDPFAGSGTTAVAAFLTERHFLGYELDAEYHQKAVSRVRSKIDADCFA